MSNARNLARLLPNASGQLPDAAMASGSVLQVVQYTQSVPNSTTSSSWTSTGLTGSITPTSATSKILCVVALSARGGTSNGGAYTLFRGTVSGVDLSNSGSSQGFGDLNNGLFSPLPITYLDAPTTTSAVTYTVGIRSWVAGSIVQWSANGAFSTLTLMEIAA